MASARDLISIFVALETISIPTFVLAGWRKHDTKSNEAALKYFLIGCHLVGVDAVRHVVRVRHEQIHAARRDQPLRAVEPEAAVRGRRSSSRWSGSRSRSVPSPSTSGRRTPTRVRRPPSPRSCRSRRRRVASSRCSRSSSSGSSTRRDSWQPILWILAAASMTFGNLAALRQTNIVRMLAYSSIAQGGFILVPLAVAGDVPGQGKSAWQAVVIYILIYGAMNLGAFACVIAAARRSRSAEISSFSRARSDGTRARRRVLGVPVLARRDPAARRLVRQVRDVPRRVRRQHRPPP